MKWFIIALAAAAALIGFGLFAAGSHGDARISRDPAVVRALQRAGFAQLLTPPRAELDLRDARAKTRETT